MRCVIALTGVKAASPATLDAAIDACARCRYGGTFDDGFRRMIAMRSAARRATDACTRFAVVRRVQSARASRHA